MIVKQRKLQEIVYGEALVRSMLNNTSELSSNEKPVLELSLLSSYD